MAFPVIHTTASSQSNGTSHVVTLPTGITSGDLVLVVVRWKATIQLTLPTGWQISDQPPSRSVFFFRYADGTEGSTITFTSNITTRAVHLAYRITGYKSGMSMGPFTKGAFDWTSSATPLVRGMTPLGATKDFLWIAIVGWDDGAVTATSAPSGYSGLFQVADGDASAGVGIASCQRDLATTTTANVAFPLSAARRSRTYSIAVWPDEVDAVLPSYTTMFETDWPVLKSNSGMFGPNFRSRLPYGSTNNPGGAADPDYPRILLAGALKTISQLGHNVLTVDRSGSEDASGGACWFYEIGPEGPTPGNPAAGSGGNPTGGWFHAQAGRIIVDTQLNTASWDESDYNPIVRMFDTRSGNEVMSLYIILLNVPTNAEVLVPEFQFYTSTPVNDYFHAVDTGSLPRATWENKRVRWTIAWQCGIGDPADQPTIPITTDGFLRVTIQELPSGPEIVLYSIQAVPLFMSYLDYAGQPSYNYLNSAILGYYGLWDTELLRIEVPGVAAPVGEQVFNPDEASIGLTWIEFTDANNHLHIWSNIALPDPSTYYGGFKEHRVLEFQAIRRSLSNYEGHHEGIIWSWVLIG